MFDVFEQLATDEGKETGGTWFPLGDGKLLVARSGNANYGKKLSEAYERNRVILDSKTPAADELSKTVMIDVMAETILLGWDGIGYKGKALDYSVENAKLLLSVGDFRRQVVKFSEDFEAFKLKVEVAQGEA